MRLVAVVNLELEIADLPVNVEPEAGTASELKHLSPRAPVVAGAIANAHGVRVSVELAIVDALNTVH